MATQASNGVYAHLVSRCSIPLPQDRRDACHQVLWAEWFDDVVVSADLKSVLDISIVTAGGEHDHRSARLAPDLFAHLEAIASRQVDFEHDEIWTVGRPPRQGLMAVVCWDHVEAVPLQDSGGEVSDVHIAVNQQNPGRWQSTRGWR